MNNSHQRFLFVFGRSGCGFTNQVAKHLSENQWPFIYEAFDAKGADAFWEKADTLGGGEDTPRTFPRIIMCKKVKSDKYERRIFDSVQWMKYVGSAEQKRKDTEIKSEISQTLGQRKPQSLPVRKSSADVLADVLADKSFVFLPVFDSNS